MIWLQRPPWIRWTLAVMVAVGAIWTEFRGDGTVEHRFATEVITSGDPISDDNTETRSIPSGLLDPVPDSGFAERTYSPGEPITSQGVSTTRTYVRTGWWALEIAIPAGANQGDEVQLVLLDHGLVVPGVVTAAAQDDPLATGNGSIAVPPEHAAMAAEAAANGRVVVLVATG